MKWMNVETLKPGFSGFRTIVFMSDKERLRTRLMLMIQELPLNKLHELGMFLRKITGRSKSKEKTLKMAGAWNDLDEDLFLDLTERLHERRLNDRQPIDL
jgi:hypothetical protein